MPNDEPLGCLGQFLALIGIKPQSGDRKKLGLPYRRQKNFLSAAELSFYHVLKKVLADRAVICPKVRISDVLAVANRSKNMSHANRIDRKHVDFVICDPSDMSILGVIELDDSSHNTQRGQKRDRLVNSAFEAARVPIIRVRAARSYEITSLTEQLSPLLNVSPSDNTGATNEEDVASLCPKCDSELVRRTAKKGKQAGRKFWGCSNYPSCRYTRSIDD